MKFRKKNAFFIVIPTLIFFLSGLVVNTFAQNSASIHIDSLSPALNRFFSDRKVDDPGGVLIIKKGGNEIYHRVFGKSNLETGTKITDETIFEAASVSKQFTAAAVLKLIANGKLELKDDIRKYIPELPDYGVLITIRHLLTHTSGLKDWRNVVYITPLSTATRLFTQDMALDVICRQTTLNFKPGDQYRYSNSGYDLLGTVVERVSGKKFADFVSEALLSPAGMQNSFFRGKYTDIVKNRALGYLTVNGKYIQGQILDETHGAAGLYTTSDDLQKWNAYIYSDKVSSAIRELRLDQFVLNDGTKIPYANGGVEIRKHNGYTEIHHGGLISGYRAWLAYYPESEISVSYMSNDRNIMTTELSKTINTALFGEPGMKSRTIEKEVNPTLTQLKALEGIYINTNDHSVYLDLEIRDGQLWNNKMPVKFFSKHQFLIDDQIYDTDHKGFKQITKEGSHKFKKMERFSSVNEVSGMVEGKFRSDDGNITLEFLIVEGKIYAQRSGHDRFELFPLFKNGKTLVFRGLTNGLRALFYFTPEKNTQSLKVSLPRAADIPFYKQFNSLNNN